MSATFVVCHDLEALSLAAADHVLSSARAVVAARGRCAVALAGGGTPRRLYQMLAAAERHAAFPWDETSWWWGDERCVPPDHPESNYRMAFEALLGPAGVDAEHIHRIAGERPPEDAARGYEAALRGALPDGAFDVVLLGVGPDGHTASLFPGSRALEERTRWAVATEAGPDQAVRERVTLTYPVLDRARDVLVLVAGAGKDSVVAAMRDDLPYAVRAYPVARLSPAGSLTWYVDRSAMR